MNPPAFEHRTALAIGAVYSAAGSSLIKSPTPQAPVAHAALAWFAIAAAAALMWYAWREWVLKPSRDLLRFVKALAENGAAVENPLTGSSELSEVARILEQNYQTLRHALNALAMREQLLAVTLRSIGNGLITTDWEGKVTAMNPIAEKLTGWDLESGRGVPIDNVLSLINVQTGVALPLPVAQVIETQQVIEQDDQVLLYSRNGLTFHIEVKTAPILGEDGGILGLIVTFNDVSETFFLREQLRDEKQYLQHLLDNSATAIYSLVSLPGVKDGFYFNYASTRLEALSGFSISEWENSPDLWRSRVHPDDWLRVEHSKQQAIDQGHVICSYRFLRADGSYRWIEDHLTALVNAAGEVYELLGGWLDVTENRKTEQKNQLFGAMIDQSINEIMAIDSRSLAFLHVNQGSLKNLGYSAADLAEMTLPDIYVEYDQTALLQLIAPLSSNQQAQRHLETLVKRRDGSTYPVEVWMQLHHQNDETLSVIALDITERKQQQQKIKRLNNFYATLSKINQAIVQIRNEDELFAHVCNIVVELNHVRMAWVGKLDAETGRVMPVAAAGEQLHYLDGLLISIDPALPEGQGPSAVALRENRIVSINDFQHDVFTAHWHDNADRRFGWQASCGVPITLNDQPYAVMNVYAGQVDFFDSEVLALMHELGVDLSFALDSYQREAARCRVERQMELWSKVFSQNREAVVIVDRQSRIVSVNQAFTRITGYSEQQVIGKNSRRLSSAVYAKGLYRNLCHDLHNEGFWQGELVERKKDGSLYNVWLSISAVADETGETSNYIAIFTDITQLKSAKRQIEHLAHYDALTHLPNRLLLKARVDHSIAAAERNKQTFALLFIDLDHFKNINDALGHSVGDQILIEVGKRLLAAVREEDTVARVGGDEFIMQLSDTDWHGAAKVAKKIIAALEQPICHQHYRLYVQPSIGIGLYPENGDSFETLSRNADTALYKAKERGRNQYQFFTSAMQQQTQRRMEVERHLRHALENQELMLYYQPLINTKTQHINGAEALLRWRHPELGWVSPAEFIPVAEECGLILSVGDWALEQAIKQAKCWHNAGYPISVAVNLSLAQFRANTLCETVRYFLEKYQLPPHFLELELTESIAMHNVEAAIAITQQLSDLGCEISIDDFGTGYSSLSYLQRFSLNKLKIDQSFTRGMVDQKESENIVDAIIGLAKSLKMKTIAEGVETEHQWVIYMEKDCDEIQGYYFSKPVPPEEFDLLLQSER